MSVYVIVDDSDQHIHYAPVNDTAEENGWFIGAQGELLFNSTRAMIETP